MEKTVIFLSIVLFTSFNKLSANNFIEEFSGVQNLATLYNKDEFEYPKECLILLTNFAQQASNFTMCSIVHAHPVRLCEKCINQYVSFMATYRKLQAPLENGTLCSSFFISRDRLDVLLEYYQSILAVWTKGNCNACYDWSEKTPILSNNTKHFNNMFNETMSCITSNQTINNTDEICQRCLQSYVQLDSFYISLSKDSVGLDGVCFDIVDSMNMTRSIWSKTLNCCKLLKSPEIIFLCCTAIISFLPILFYVAVRYCGPLRDLPSVLKESRFKQSFLRSNRGRIN